MRNVLSAPTNWAFDLSYFMYGALFMMAGAYTLSRNGHVRGDVLYRLMPVRVQASVDLVLFITFLAPGFPRAVLLRHSLCRDFLDSARGQHLQPDWRAGLSAQDADPDRGGADAMDSRSIWAKAAVDRSGRPSSRTAGLGQIALVRLSNRIAAAGGSIPRRAAARRSSARPLVRQFAGGRSEPVGQPPGNTRASPEPWAIAISEIRSRKRTWSVPNDGNSGRNAPLGIRQTGA